MLNYVVDCCAVNTTTESRGWISFWCCPLVVPNLAAALVDIFLCQAAGVSTAEPAAEAHRLASN